MNKPRKPSSARFLLGLEDTDVDENLAQCMLSSKLEARLQKRERSRAFHQKRFTSLKVSSAASL